MPGPEHDRVKPFSPQDVESIRQKRVIPKEVFSAFNELLAENSMRGSERITVHQNELVKRMEKKGLNSETIFKNGWLDVEDIYEDQGWEVSYRGQGYNETHEPSFTFSPRRRRRGYSEE